VICGAESWDEIAAFGEAKQTWLESFLDLPNGVAGGIQRRHVGTNV
jgi:hypothetical protein